MILYREDGLILEWDVNVCYPWYDDCIYVYIVEWSKQQL